MPGEVNTYDSLRAAIAAPNPTDYQIREALREIYEAITRGYVQPWVVLDQSAVPTDIAVQAATAGGVTAREVFDGMVVAIRNSTRLVLYQRVAGVWIEIKNA